MPASVIFLKPLTARESSDPNGRRIATTGRSGSQHFPRAGADADPSTPPMFGGSASTSSATRGGSPRVAFAAAWSAVGGAAPGMTGVCVSGAETSVGVAEGSFTSTAGGAVEIATQAPGPVGRHEAGPGRITHFSNERFSA